MNIALCIAWFMFGFIVGWILLIGIALGIKEKEDKESGKDNNDKSKQ